MATANERQVGGKHYQSEYQHWDLMVNTGMGLDYLRGAATKYLSRWRDKGGIQDLEKAGHYVQKLQETFANKERPKERDAFGTINAKAEDFALLNNIPLREFIAIRGILNAGTGLDLNTVIATIDEILVVERAKPTQKRGVKTYTPQQILQGLMLYLDDDYARRLLKSIEDVAS